MTREEQYIRKINNKLLICKRGIFTAAVFLKHDGALSDIELADLLISMGIKTSSSTVGRDLKKLKEYYETYNEIFDQPYVLSKEQVEIIKTVLEKRKNNSIKAKVTGGKHYAENNIAIKGSDTKFKGSKKRG